MKIDARTIATVIAVNLAAAIVIAWLARRSPTLRALIEP